MRIALAVAVLLAAQVGAGCLSDVVDTLTGGRDLEDRELLRETHPFSYVEVIDPTSPPASPDEAYQRAASSFQVPADTEEFQVLIQVQFDDGPAGPAPDEFQSVRFLLIDVDGNQQRDETLTVTGALDWSVEDPLPGEWTLRYAARGQGTLFWFVQAGVLVEG